MGDQMLGISEATRGWQVSERTLRRRLSDNRIDGAERDDNGQWRIPAEWLDREFVSIPNSTADDLVIDLRDGVLPPPDDLDLGDDAIASGLAEALAGFSDLTDRVIEAEVTAALASNESDKLNDRVRRLQDDLDAERARAERLQFDLSETENALAIDRDRRARTERDLEAARAGATAAADEHRTELEDLRATHAESSNKLAALEAFIGRRTRAKFGRYLAERDQG